MKSRYAGCKTTPVSVEELAGPAPVTRGVEQGCSLSGLLFNLNADTLLNEATSIKSVHLGYLDDSAIIMQDKKEVQEIISRTLELAESWFFFQCKKSVE